MNSTFLRTISTPLILAGIAAAASNVDALAANWPTYRHDAHRSGLTADPIDPSALTEHWRVAFPYAPKPAWDGPPRWDAYRKMDGIKSMRNFDPVFHPILADGRVYFGSSTDDALHCLSLESGAELWRFVTDGPVRIAPTWEAGRIYFGSDDGHAYCLDGASGALIWKFSPSAGRRKVLNDGKLISFWPVRTGVLVEGATAYFGASMLPWKLSYICAVDAKSGRPVGEGRFVREYSDLTLEGAMLATETRLIAPQGRVSPLLFDRADGAPHGGLKSAAGCFVVVTDDDHVIHQGGAYREKGIRSTDVRTKTTVASYPDGNAMVVAGRSSYVLTDSALVAVDRYKREQAWQIDVSTPHSLILAGDTLVAGGNDEVNAISKVTGEVQWSGEVLGRAYGLAAAGGVLVVTTDDGAIHCFGPGSAGIGTPIAGRTPTPVAPATLGDYAALVRGIEADPALEAGSESEWLSAEPVVEFIAPGRARIQWRTSVPTPTLIECTLNRGIHARHGAAEPATDHAVVIDGLKRNSIYHFRPQAIIDGRLASTAQYECDTHFNFTPEMIPGSGEASDGAGATAAAAAAAAERILADSNVDRGLAVVLNCGDGALALELARRSRLRVIGFVSTSEEEASARAHLSRAKAYGSRVTVHRVSSLAEASIPGHFANLIVDAALLRDGRTDVSAAEIVDLLAPSGGKALVGQPPGFSGSVSPVDPEWFAGWLEGTGPASFPDAAVKTWVLLTAPALPGSGQWSHQYGRPNNSAFGGESLLGASKSSDLEVQWVGRPGPRYQPDRQPRKPSPLSTNGRLFLQGLDRMIALDAFNGSILWGLEIPGFRRFNIHRDTSNWCADGDRVYAAVGGHCWKIAGSTGAIEQRVPVPATQAEEGRFDWGYLASVGDRLIGSAVRKGSSYTGYWGGEFWYDQVDGPLTHKVCSDRLFSLEKETGIVGWTYQRGMILNCSITIGDGRIFFVESRHPSLATADTGRLGPPELWMDQAMVALDLSTGQILWETPIDTVDGVSMFNLAYSDEKLVVASSGAGKFHVYAFAGDSGVPQWEQEVPWPSNHHGGHLARPVIVENRLFLRPAVMELDSGKVLELTMVGGGCGTYAATRNALFFRSSTVTIWDSYSGERSGFDRLRPDCWLSTIPAQGMLLSPEGGGGCSCGSWLETSVGFMPKKQM